jgi:hypothetical protein
MIKLISVSLAPLLVAGSMIQPATARQPIAKHHSVITASKNTMNANASLPPGDTDSLFAGRNQVHYEHRSGQDGQPPRLSIYPPYLQGTCWDVGTCD